jgi:hypothetical protein
MPDGDRQWLVWMDLVHLTKDYAPDGSPARARVFAAVEEGTVV